MVESKLRKESNVNITLQLDDGKSVTAEFSLGTSLYDTVKHFQKTEGGNLFLPGIVCIHKRIEFESIEVLKNTMLQSLNIRGDKGNLRLKYREQNRNCEINLETTSGKSKLDEEKPKAKKQKLDQLPSPGSTTKTVLKKKKITNGSAVEIQDDHDLQADLEESVKKEGCGKLSALDKHIKFTSEFMDEKDVTEIPGIDETLGKQLHENGFECASKVYGNFLIHNQAEAKFKPWLGELCRANDVQLEQAFKAMVDYAETYL